MTITQVQQAGAKEIVEEIQRQPPEVQRTILNMLHGAIAISDMYQALPLDSGQSAERPGA